MTSAHPYPEREHLELPTTPWDVIDDELRVYGAGASFRGGLVVLSRVYGRTPLLIGFKKYAVLMHLATTISDPAEALSQNGLDMDFYVGEILATHCLIRPEPQQTRHFLYNYPDILPEYILPTNKYYDDDGNAYDFRVDHELLLGDTEDLMEFRYASWQDSFAEMPEPLQEKAIEASIKAYSDDGNASARENDFLVGFSNASRYIGELISSPYLSLP